ncbi:MAG: hypothetical protein U1E15_09335 [Hyphomicrobiales bacterium]
MRSFEQPKILPRVTCKSFRHRRAAATPVVENEGFAVELEASSMEEVGAPAWRCHGALAAARHRKHLAAGAGQSDAGRAR